MSPETQPGAPNAARGIVIVVVAGLVGLFLLARGGTSTLLDTSEPAKVAGAPVTTVENVPTIAPDSTVVKSEGESEGQPAADVTVMVFNATAGAITGAAGDAQSKLTPLGYDQITLADAPTAIEATAVYWSDGFEANAQAIADALGYDAGVVTPAEGAQDNPGAGSGSNVVVVIGTDAAPTTDG